MAINIITLGNRTKKSKWKAGVMQGGTFSSKWHSGIAIGGQFLDAEWNRGQMDGGNWRRGNWYSLDLSGNYDKSFSVWNSGIWYNDKNPKIKVDNIFRSIWNGGTWNSQATPFSWSGDLQQFFIDNTSVWLENSGSMFLGGVWRRGEWNGGTMWGSTFQSLTLSNSYNITQSVWNSGKFLKSVWHGGEWNNSSDDLRGSQFGGWINQTPNTTPSITQIKIGSGIKLNPTDELPILDVPNNALTFQKFGKTFVQTLSPYNDQFTNVFSSIWLRGNFNGGMFNYSSWFSVDARRNQDISYPTNTTYNSSFNRGLFFNSQFNGGQVIGLDSTITFHTSEFNLGHWRSLSGTTSQVFQNSVWNAGIWEGGESILSVHNSGVRGYIINNNTTSGRDNISNIAADAITENSPKYLAVPIPEDKENFIFIPGNILNSQGSITTSIKINGSAIKTGKGDLFWYDGDEWNQIVNWTSGETQNLTRLLGELNNVNGFNNMVRSGTTTTATPNYLLFTGRVDNRASAWLNGTARGSVFNGGEWRKGTFTYYRVKGSDSYDFILGEKDWFGIDWSEDKIEPGVWTRGIWRGGYFGVDQITPEIETPVIGRFITSTQTDNEANLKSIWMSLPVPNPSTPSTIWTGTQNVNVMATNTRLGVNSAWAARQMYYDSANIPTIGTAAKLPLPDKTYNQTLTDSGNANKIPTTELLTGQFSSLFTRNNQSLSSIPVSNITGNVFTVASAITLSYNTGITEVVINVTGSTPTWSKYIVQGVTGNTFSLPITGVTGVFVAAYVVEYSWSEFNGQFVNGIFDDSRRFDSTGTILSELGYKVPYMGPNAIFGNVNNVLDDFYLPLDRVEFDSVQGRRILTWDPISGIESVFPASIKWDGTLKLDYEWTEPPIVGDEDDSEPLFDGGGGA